jgi:RNA polymerase sigma-70 factor (ECF subfamily)
MPMSRIESSGVTAQDVLAAAHRDAAFADLVLPLVPPGQRLAFGMLQNAQEAEDAVQEATFKAWRAFPRFREGTNARAWFLTIVANECRQRRRSRWWSVVRPAPPAEPGPAREGSSEAAMDLRRTLSRLPAEMKLAIVLRYYLDLPFDEVGGVLGVSDKAAKARVHRALARLRLEVPEELADA